MNKKLICMLILAQSTFFLHTTEKKLATPKRHKMTCMQRVVVALGFMSALQGAQGADCNYEVIYGHMRGDTRRGAFDRIKEGWECLPYKDVTATVVKSRFPHGPGHGVTEYTSLVPLCPYQREGEARDRAGQLVSQQISDIENVDYIRVDFSERLDGYGYDRCVMDDGIKTCSYSCVRDLKGLIMRLIKRD